jgi:cytochrome b involved in lipid metabolism
MKLAMVFALAAVLLLAGCASETGGASAPQEGGNATAPAGNATQPESGGNGTAAPAQGISASELAMHGSEADCWVLYSGNVYDVTAYLEQHAGGPGSIIPYCGKSDSSFADAFEGKHGTSKVGVLEGMGALKGEFSG